jgi:hypothetical protein
MTHQQITKINQPKKIKMKKSKQLFENQNLMKLKKLYKIEVNFFTYWDVTGWVMKKDMYIEE